MSQAVTPAFQITMPSDGKYLHLVRAVVDGAARRLGFSAEDLHTIALAVTEAVTNVIRHVYDNATDQRIDLTLHPSSRTLRLEITDYGTYVDPATIASRPLEDVRPGGLGVHLIKSTMDEVAYQRNEHGGTTLTLVKSPTSEKDPT